MKMYETISEAIEIARSTYKGRQYTIGVYESAGRTDRLICTVTGNAARIYGEQFFHDMKKDNITLWPIDDRDVEGCALMETIFAVPMHRAPHYSWEIEARDFLNSIVEEAEKRDI